MTEVTTSGAMDNMSPEVLGACAHCNAVLTLPRNRQETQCPYCGQEEFSPLEADEENPLTAHPPELLLPFTADGARVRTELYQFVKGTWFSPEDMSAGKLNGRLQPFFLPMWLVDADVQARWRAEVGFNYEVVSHREQFQAGNWHTQRIKETKIRWEPRLGQLARHYANRPAPALEEQAALDKVLGRFKIDGAQPYRPASAGGAVQRHPNRMPDDAWPEAEAAIKRAATSECQQAAGAEHIREYQWSAQFNNRNWTQLLLPIYTTYYIDDDGETQMVYIHGQTGRVVGQKRASMAQARKWALGGGAAALLLLLLTFILGLVGYTMSPDLLPLSGVSLVATIFVAGAAFIPLLLAFYLNKFAYFSAANTLRTALRQPVATREEEG